MVLILHDFMVVNIVLPFPFFYFFLVCYITIV